MSTSDLETTTTLDCFEILKNNEYWMIESICVSIRQYPKNHVDEFMLIHYLRNDELLTKISEQLSCSCLGNDSLSAALLLILPFVNCSSKIEQKVCEKYLFDKRGNNHFCRGLVYALSRKITLISLQTKTWIMCTLCYLIEAQHNLKMSAKIKDAYGGLVKYSLQILQCPNIEMMHESDMFKIKQYAIRILLCELNEGVMARQHLKDQYSNLIILQTIIQLHDEYECNARCDYDEYQWLMVKLLQYLYLSFDFDDLWLSFDDYRSQCIECQGLDIVHNGHSSNSEHAFNDNVKSHYLRLYLMTRCQFGRLLKIKCKLFLESTKGIFIKVALNILLSYPLNDAYGLLRLRNEHHMHPLNKYNDKEYIENFDKNAYTDTDTETLHHPYSVCNAMPHCHQQHQNGHGKKHQNKKNNNKKGNKHKNKPKNGKNKNKNKQNGKQKATNDHKSESAQRKRDRNNGPSPAKQQKAKNSKEQKQTYSGPNWQYEFERMLKGDSDWSTNIVDHLITLSENMSNINIINTINIASQTQ